MKNLFQRIRGLYGMDNTIIEAHKEAPKEVIPGSEGIHSETKKEDNLVTDDIDQLIEKSRGNGSAGQVVKDPAYYGENVTRPKLTFMQNMEAVELEFAGIGKGLGKPYEDKNVTDPKNTFIQNLDAVSLDLTGEGTGPVPIQTENSYNPKKDLVENLMQVNLDSEGNGDVVKMIKENVTDPKKGMLENLDAIAENFSGTSIESRPGKIKIEKKKSAGR
jgi:hypothetical protein